MTKMVNIGWNPYYITLLVIYAAAAVPAHLLLFLLTFIRFVLYIKKCKRDFVTYVHFMLVIFSLGNIFNSIFTIKVKFLSMTFELVDICIERTVYEVRIVVPALDCIATQLLIMLLDTVIISWTKINATSGREIDIKTFKVVTIIVVVKHILVFGVILGYTIVTTGNWDAGLSLGWTIAFSTAVCLNAISFWTLFIVMSRKTTQLVGASTTEAVIAVHKKVRNIVTC
jgi:hypothetical protein